MRLTHRTMLLVSFALVTCYSCRSLLYPDYIRSEFYNSYQPSTRSGVDSAINIKGYYELQDSRSGLDISFIFFSNGLFNYQTSINGSEETYSTVYCGVYNRRGDTIKAKYMSNPTFNGGFTAFKMDLLILDDQTLKVLCERAFHEGANFKKCGYEKHLSLATFVPLDTLPEPKCWLLEEDWFYK